MDADRARAAVESATWQLGADDDDRTMAMDATLLLCVVGSTVHGLAVQDGVEDLDVMGICCEPPERVIGWRPFHQWVGRTNLLPLFVRPDHVLMDTPLGVELRASADAFASRQAGERFLGYATAQRERLEGKRGQLRVHRPDLVALYGFDTKFAGHLLRLAHQGIEYLTTGRLTLPIPDPLGAHLRDVRTGRVPLAKVLAEAEDAEARLTDLLTSSPLPERPDVSRVEAFVMRAYRARWSW